MNEANELLKNQMQQLSTNNEALKSSVASLTKSLQVSEETLKREKGNHYKEEDNLASSLNTMRQKLA